FKDLQEGVTLHEEVDEVTGLSRHVVADSPDEKRQPAIVIKGKSSKRYLMPSRAHLMIQDGDTVSPGDVLAKIPRETTKTKDITGGLPRVVELFEARKPHETAVISEIDGTVKFGEVSKGQRKIYVVADNGTEKEYSVPRGVHINVQEGERVKAGEPLMDGPLNPHYILAGCCCWASPRLRSRPTRSSRRRRSRRPRACSPKPRSRARWTTCAA